MIITEITGIVFKMVTCGLNMSSNVLFFADRYPSDIPQTEDMSKLMINLKAVCHSAFKKLDSINILKNVSITLDMGGINKG
jgi:hypothetical protein